MPLQKEVRQFQAAASAGKISRNLHSYNSVQGAIAADDKVRVGGFVKRTASTQNGEVAGASGVAVTASTDKIVGVCLKSNLVNSVQTPIDTFTKGNEVSYIERGYVWIETQTTAKFGQFVFLKDDDGSLVFDDSNTKENHTFTGWKVSQGAEAETSKPQLIEIVSVD